MGSYRGKTTLYISHGADLSNPDWFLIEAAPAGLEREVKRFYQSGRTVYEIKARPWRPRLRWLWNRENRRHWFERRRVIRGR